jgi:hypothetical protein
VIRLSPTSITVFSISWGLKSRHPKQKIIIILSTMSCRDSRTFRTSSKNFILNKMTTFKIPVVKITRRAWRQKLINKSDMINLKIAFNSKVLETVSSSLNAEIQSSMIYPMSTEDTCRTGQLWACHSQKRIRSPAKMSSATLGTQPLSRCLLYLYYLIESRKIII